MAHIVYNLTFDKALFSCAGYEFTRVPTYEEACSKVYLRPRVAWNASTGRWQVSQKERPGAMMPTYVARWCGQGPEPESHIHQGGAPRIFDILLLWSLWGGEFACTGERVLLETPTFSGEPFFQTKEELRATIDATVPVLAAALVKLAGLYPALFLIIESFKTQVGHYQTLFISPAIDALAGKAAVPPLPQADSERLEAIKQELAGVLEARRPQEVEKDVHCPPSGLTQV